MTSRKPGMKANLLVDWRNSTAYRALSPVTRLVFNAILMYGMHELNDGRFDYEQLHLEVRPDRITDAELRAALDELTAFEWITKLNADNGGTYQWRDWALTQSTKDELAETRKKGNDRQRLHRSK